MSQRREVAQELSEEVGVRVEDFGFTAHLSETTAAVGTRLREALGITLMNSSHGHPIGRHGGAGVRPSKQQGAGVSVS